MPTKSVKLAMQKEAKKIASTEYKDRIERVRNLGTLEYTEITIPAVEIRNDHINWILRNHPEFDPNTFRQMIKEFGSRNKDKREKLNDNSR